MFIIVATSFIDPEKNGSVRAVVSSLSARGVESRTSSVTLTDEHALASEPMGIQSL